MDLSPELLKRFPPSWSALLEVACRHVTDDMLQEIADADYGNGFDRHLASLRVIRDRRTVLADLDWNPSEVLALTRWSNPDNPEHKPGSVGLRGHQMRAIACAALLASDDDESSIARCLVSARAIGLEMSEALGCYLTWIIPQTSRRWDQLLYLLALLVVSLRVRDARIDDRMLGELAALYLDAESSVRKSIDPSNPEPAPFGLVSGFWKPAAEELLDAAKSISTRDLRENLTLIGATVLGDS